LREKIRRGKLERKEKRKGRGGGVTPHKGGKRERRPNFPLAERGESNLIIWSRGGREKRSWVSTSVKGEYPSWQPGTIARLHVKEGKEQEKEDASMPGK